MLSLAYSHYSQLSNKNFFKSKILGFLGYVTTILIVNLIDGFLIIEKAVLNKNYGYVRSLRQPWSTLRPVQTIQVVNDLNRVCWYIHTWKLLNYGFFTYRSLKTSITKRGLTKNYTLITYKRDLKNKIVSPFWFINEEAVR